MALFTNPLGRASTTYLGRMTWAELQASAYANNSVGLSGLDADASVFVTDWRVAMVPNAGKTYWECPHPIVIDRHATASGYDVVYTGNGTTCTAVASASAGAATRCTITGHGLTSANNGVSVYVSAGANWTAGFYAMTYVDANNIDLAVAWNASFGNPTVTSVTGGSVRTTLRSVALPAGLMQATSVIELATSWQLTSSANNHYCTVELGGSTAMFMSPGSVSHLPDRREIRNRGAKNAQICTQPQLGGYSGGTASILAVDTASAQTLDFRADLRTVNEYIRIAGYTVSVIV